MRGELFVARSIHTCVRSEEARREQYKEALAILASRQGPTCELCGLPSEDELCAACWHALAREQNPEEEAYRDDPNALKNEEHLVAQELLRSEMQ